MSAGALWHAFRWPVLIAVITGWALIAALFSDGGLELVALVLLTAVVGLVASKLFQGFRAGVPAESPAAADRPTKAPDRRLHH